MSKKVSIIIPCYNNGKFVSEAIESALNQTYKDIEIVIVNDGSTDNSSEVIKEYADKNKNILFFDNEENHGVVYARNMAIEACRGEYILPLDSDDIIENTYVEKAVEILDKNPDISIVYCETLDFNDGIKRFYPPFDELKFRYQNMIFVTAMYRKSDWVEVGGYKEYMKNGYEDWEFWISLIEMGKKPYRIQEGLFRVRNVSGSRNDKAFNNYHDILLKTIINNHRDFYLENDDFVKNSFSYLRLKNRFERRKRKFLTAVSILSVILLLSLGFNIYWACGG
ncbi:glycosyltransferase family 2 protein [bacterium]|nr:glycosyltransferase family 2 protein [bacterium]